MVVAMRQKKAMTNAVSLVRLSIPAETPEQRQAFIRDGGIPEPTYGGQLQDFALQGAKPEGKVNISYTDVPVEFKKTAAPLLCVNPL